MSKYAVDVSTRPKRRYEALVILPLSLVTIFCFSFVILHSRQGQTSSAAAVASGSIHRALPPKVVVELTEPLPHLSKVTTTATPTASTISALSTPNTSAIAVPTQVTANGAQQITNPGKTSTQDDSNVTVRALTRLVNSLRASTNSQNLKNTVK